MSEKSQADIIKKSKKRFRKSLVKDIKILLKEKKHKARIWP